MDSLMDTVSGAYRIVTLASTYLIDLDREMVYREPRTGHPDSTLLPRDEPITLLEVLECSVGRRMILLLHLHVCGIPLTARYSTQVVFSINHVPSLRTEAAQ